jgi:hypothetical protein|tara:strand:- start:9419 stop:9670 length:252 start_codon:yes stop_codon:yes gene_type:complete
MGLFTQIHEILFLGKGGYDFETVYNMPIWLRKFTFSRMENYYNEESKPQNEQGKSTLINTDGQVNTPEFLQASKPYKGKSSYK